MTIQKVLVTGSDGRIGRVVVAELRSNGYRVTPADIAPSQPWGTRMVDFEDLGQVVGEMHGHDAVIHLAAIPTPTVHPAEVVFRTNVLSTFNVLEAATILGIDNVVMASSLSALGFPFEYRRFNPVRLPIDEEHPLLSQDSYGLSKTVGEELADGFVRRTPSMSLASMRFTTVLDEPGREGIAAAREAEDGGGFHGAFWTYVDVRDAATSCRLALEYSEPGHEAFYITAPTTYVREPVEELLERHYPGDYPVADHIRGDVSPVDCAKAERLLGWRARYGWDGTEL
jgi:nucleoside-diphosphate-sugar epimerase